MRVMTASDVVGELENGMTIGIGGWGSRRKPMTLVRAILDSDLKDLHIVSYGGDIKELPNLPKMIDLAKTDEHKAMVRFLEVAPRVGMGFWVSPEVPKARAGALRTAFQAMLRDPAFLSDAAKRKAPVSPVSGEELDKIVAAVYQTPPATIAKLKKVFGFK